MSQSLKEQFQEMLNAESDTFPPDVLKIFLEETERLINSGIEKNALLEGSQLPAFALPDATGKIVKSDELLSQGPLIINFYRGSWCPYCQIELRAYRDRLDEIKSLGGQFIAISPEKPDLSLSMAEKNNLEFPVLTDAHHEFSEALGIVFDSPSALHFIHNEYGSPIPQHNFDGSWRIPIPATYVVAADGRIALANVEPNYFDRLEPDAAVEALKNLK